MIVRSKDGGTVFDFKEMVSMEIIDVGSNEECVIQVVLAENGGRVTIGHYDKHKTAVKDLDYILDKYKAGAEFVSLEKVNWVLAEEFKC